MEFDTLKLSELTHEQLTFAQDAIRGELNKRNVPNFTPVDQLYFQNFDNAFGIMNKVINRAIENEILPEMYRMPQLDTFNEERIALWPHFKKMHRKRSAAPAAVFYPRGLNQNQWDILLSGHAYTHQDEEFFSEGIDYESNPAGGRLKLPISRKKENVWSVALIGNINRPTVLKVSADGIYGRVAEARRELLGVNNAKGNQDISTGELIQQLSPSHEVYYSYKLGMLAVGDNITGFGYAVLGKEKVKFHGTELGVIHRPVVHPAKVYTEYESLSFNSHRLGVMPTVTAAQALEKLQKS